MLKVIIGILLSLGLGSAIAIAEAPHFFHGWHEHKDRDHVVATPEIDPASAASGLTLLLGGLAVLRGRRLKSQ